VKIDVRHNFPQALAQINGLQRDLRDKVLAGALNRVGDKARTETSRAIRAEYNITADRVRNSLVLRRATSRGGRLVVELQAFGSGSKRGRSLNIKHFMEQRVTLAEARRRRKGGSLNVLRFKFRRTGGVKALPQAFVLNVPGLPVFQRVGPGRKGIEPMQVIDVPQMFNARKILKQVLARIDRAFPVEIASQLRRFIR
jgi:hypothetical protein